MKFSRRTNWPREKNVYIDTFQKVKNSGVSVVDLTASNPTQCHFATISKNLTSSVFTKDDNLIYTPDSQGLKSARQAVAKYYDKRNIHVDPDDIFLTASTSEGYSYLFRLLTEPKEKVLFPTPSYPLFQFLVDLNDIEMRNYQLQYDDMWRMDITNLCNQITHDTKAIIQVNPNNPTGSYTKRGELDRINALCKEHQLAILCDEVFWDYSLKEDQARISLAENKEVLTFTISGISKVLGMPQMKLSWIVVNGPRDVVEEAKQRLSIIADTYLSVSTPVQNAFTQWVGEIEGIQSEIKTRIRANHTYLEQVSQESSWKFLIVEGGWYATIQLPEGFDEEEEALKLLTIHHVFVHPGYFFDFANISCWVISLLPCEDDFIAGVDKIAKHFN